jgi:hypothetical protein
MRVSPDPAGRGTHLLIVRPTRKRSGLTTRVEVRMYRKALGFWLTLLGLMLVNGVLRPLY